MKKTKGTDPIYLKLFELEPSKKDLKKIEIVLAAIDCIAEVGLEPTTFEAIARKLKTGPSHIAYYFPNKTEIIEAAIRFALGSAQDLTVSNIQKATRTKDKIEAIVRSSFEWARIYPKHALVFILFQHLSTFDEKRKAMHTQIRQVGRDRIVQVLQTNDKNISVSAKEAQILALQMQNLTLANLFESFVITSPYTANELEETTVKEILKILKGII